MSRCSERSITTSVGVLGPNTCHFYPLLGIVAVLTETMLDCTIIQHAQYLQASPAVISTSLHCFLNDEHDTYKETLRHLQGSQHIWNTIAPQLACTIVWYIHVFNFGLQL